MRCNMAAHAVLYAFLISQHKKKDRLSRRSLQNLLGRRLRRVSQGRSSGPLERLLYRLIGAIERSAGFRQSSHQCGPRLLPRLVHPLVLFLRRGSAGFHLLHGSLYFAPTLSCELFASSAEIVGSLAPRFHLGGSLTFKGRLLLLNLLAEANAFFIAPFIASTFKSLHLICQ